MKTIRGNIRQKRVGMLETDVGYSVSTFGAVRLMPFIAFY